MTNWGWSAGAQETAEFNILAQYYSAYLGILFRRFEKFEACPEMERPPFWNFWKITLVDYDTHYSEYDPEFGRRRTVMEIPR